MTIKKNYRHGSKSILLISLLCFVLAGASFLLSKPSVKSRPQKTESVQGALTKKVPPTPTAAFEKVVYKQNDPLTPTPPNNNSPILLPTSTPVPQSAEPTQPIPTTSDEFTVELFTPDGNGSFTVKFRENSTPCSILTDAKNEGKIRSVTITHYDAPLNSDYVKEINGFSDNWTFSINSETKPMGCSQYILGKGNTVIWKYN
ncbi:MAG: hypothetical protein HYT10_02005 [Candidatus Levybacteria bacterium]|nr:hypothetical protein [Candidatus Levybacteria bacterium]